MIEKVEFYLYGKTYLDFFISRTRSFSENVLHFFNLEEIKTRMTTFIKRKCKKSDVQTIIDKYRVAANITEYYIKINLP